MDPTGTRWAAGRRCLVTYLSTEEPMGSEDHMGERVDESARARRAADGRPTGAHPTGAQAAEGSPTGSELVSPEPAEALAALVTKLRTELAGVRTAMRNRAVIEQAKGVLVERLGITPDES